MNKPLIKKISILVASLLVVIGIPTGLFALKQKPQTEVVLGGSSMPGERGGTWYLYGNKFDGFQTKYDQEKIEDGANSNGQNTTINDGDRISLRNFGYDLMPSGGTLSSTTTPITNLHTFRKRDGESLLMRTYGTEVEYFEEGNNTWETIKTGYTNGKKFGFADFNINTDLRSYVYYGNDTDSMDRWDGVHSLVATAVTAGASTITVDDAQYFTATGSITYCGTTTAYSSITVNTFNLTGTAPVSCALDRGVASLPTAFPNSPKGNIYMNADNRLWVSGVASTTQAVFFSKYGDATVFTTTTLITDNTATASGIFNLGEGGGAVSAMIQDENAIYLFKRSIIRRATLSDTVYTISTLKPFDGKSQTVGSVASLSTFTSGNEVFFITPDNQIMRLARVESVDYPQVNPISDIIKPTTDAMDFASSTGIVFQTKAYFAAKSSKSSPFNDTVLVYNLHTRNWDSPIIGWNVSDFIVYDDGNGEALYWGDAITNNVYKVTSEATDYIYNVTANWRSKQFTFGLPQSLKQIDNFFIEGYISPNTSLKISLLLDDNGFTQIYNTTLTGTETGYIYSGDDYNVFGFHPFGYERFGTNADLSGKKKFRVYLNKSFSPPPFYNLQTEFASDGEGYSWEVTNFAFNVRPFTQSSKPSLFRIFQ